MNPTEYLDRVEPATKLCSKCHTRKPLRDFYKGTVCKRCDNTKPRHTSLAKVINHRARIRAQKRLQDAHPDEFAALMAEEIVKAELEADELQATASVVPHAAPHAVVQLKSGPRPAGETAADRIREDVGRCPLCINRHDRDHVCPSCGSRPQVVGQVAPAMHPYRVDRAIK